MIWDQILIILCWNLIFCQNESECTLYDEGIKIIIVKSLQMCMLAGACRKTHQNLKEYELEVAVATILKHAPNRRGGYKFEVRKTLFVTCTWQLIAIVDFTVHLRFFYRLRLSPELLWQYLPEQKSIDHNVHASPVGDV